MPDNRQSNSNGISASSVASVDGLQEAMWRLKIQTSQDKQDDGWNQYPLRPGEPDCIYFIRTGFCAYGSNCRFNHPYNAGQSSEHKVGELPERIGQPDCQYFLKTGTCKYGATCKYHHPRDRHNEPVPLNIFGLPMRQEEKSCSYYMRTGACKFGVACKFNHPQPSTVGAVLPAPGNCAYGSIGSSMISSSLPYVAGFPAWSLPSRTPYVPGSRTPSAYMPFVLAQGVVPSQQGWNAYAGALGPASSSEALRTNPVAYNSGSYYSAESGFGQPLNLLYTSTSDLPERPSEPECQYFMKTGSCKFGQVCKYHHPKARNDSSAACAIGPLGLPLRPGQAVCSSYGMHGVCKYGSACKFDHPFTGYCGYVLPAASLPEPPVISFYQGDTPVISSPNSSVSKLSKQDLIPKNEGTSSTKRPTSLEVETSQSTPSLEEPQMTSPSPAAEVSSSVDKLSS